MRQIQSGSIARPKLNNLDSDLVILSYVSKAFQNLNLHLKTVNFFNDNIHKMHVRKAPFL